MDVKLPSLPRPHLPRSLRRLLGGLRLLYLFLLVILVAETLFITTRGVDQSARARAAVLYPASTIRFTPAETDALQSLQSSPSIPAASGKGNPFTP